MKKCLGLAVILALVVGCSRSWSWGDYMAIHKDGIQKLAPSRQMNANYREVDNFIVHFGSRKQPLEWQTVAFINGRFDLTVVIPIEVDYSSRTVTQVGEPKFYLVAVQEFDPKSGYGKMDASLDRKFGLEKWAEFVRAGFDLTALGIPKHEIREIPYWKEYVHGWRKDRVPIR